MLTHVLVDIAEYINSFQGHDAICHGNGLEKRSIE